ncbi:hypothetical protein ACHHYP_09383 [Achlya hypogyna]|uniref:Uncharacterized protein n=1 Tax=Achlya hypogyna TaxID=1202772 RepID=A0A1V9ZJ15_ACHHY|nr:hypothetical protein ACHHYP_09383 [Achlya hypogyna]
MKVPPATIRHATEALGPVYVVLTVALGIYSLMLILPYMANDCLWPSFTDANVSGAIASVLNTQLTLLEPNQPSQSLDMLAPTASVENTKAPGQLSSYARKILYEELVTLESAVAGLRLLAVDNVLSMFAQYCWVDFEKRWVLAHTEARLQRCWSRYRTNGAVYFESVLRNIEYNAWVDSTQGLFAMFISDGVTEVSPVDGFKWLRSLEMHVWSPIDAEIALWRSYGIDIYLLQYSNQYQSGIDETIEIRTAMGSTNRFKIKSLPWEPRGTLWSTQAMFGGLLNDFKAIGDNRSLVMNASTFFGVDDPSAIEYYTVGFPQPAVYAAAHDLLGPLVTIDMLWEPLPPEFTAVVAQFRAHVLTAVATNKIFRTALEGVPSFTLHPKPLTWKDSTLHFAGGNPTCGYNTLLPFVQESFSFTDACATTTPLTVPVSALSSLFAWVMQGADLNTTATCDLVAKTDVNECTTLLKTTQAASSSLPPFSATMSPTTLTTLGQISLLQFVRKEGSNMTLLNVSVLHPTFAYFGWIGLYDWAMNHREVIAFHGDVASYTVLSAWVSPREIPTSNFDSNLGLYIWYCCAAVSVALAGVALLVFGIYVRDRPGGSHWFVFNRIVGAVWVNRAVCLLRGTTATLCLATAPTLPQVQSFVTQMVPVHRPWVTSALLAGESVWISYVLHEGLTPVVGYTTSRTYAPVSASIAGMLVFALDQWAPPAIAMTIERVCFSLNMGYNIVCTSGSVVVGSWQRALLLLSVHVICIPLCLVVACWRQHPSSGSKTPSLVVPAVVVAFVAPPTLTWYWEMDPVTAAMAGILPTAQPFDTKLWRRLDPASTGVEAGANHNVIFPHVRTETLQLNPRRIAWVSRSYLVLQQTWLQRFKARHSLLVKLSGLAFILCGLASNIAYLSVAQSFLSNDFGWPGLDSSGMHAFLANAFNRQLLITNSMVLDMTNTSFGDWSQSYDDATTVVVTSAHAARHQLMEPTTLLAERVRGLRNTDPCMLPWMATQYCWVDFGRTWSMASSATRQARQCTRDKANGAIYLESVLRNLQDFNTWDQCWGSSFHIGFGVALDTTQKGRMWLKQTLMAHASVEEEVTFWQAHAITGFRLQWQNYRTLSFSDAMTVTSALGYTQALHTSVVVGSMHPATQTSLRLYWTFASDLWSVATNATRVGGMSLIRGEATYAFANTTSEDLLYQNLSLLAPLSAGLDTFRSLVGPFNAIDMLYISYPDALRQLYAGVHRGLSELLLDNSVANTAFFALPLWSSLAPVPPYLLNNPDTIAIVGGNLMCGNDGPPYPALYGLYPGFSAATVCHGNYLESLVPTPVSLLFSFFGLSVMTPLLLPDSSSASVEAICTLNVYGTECPAIFAAYVEFLRVYNTSTFAPMAAAASAVGALVRNNLSIGLLQYITVNNSATELFAASLLDGAEEAWSFYGWAYLYEWVAGFREVVRFVGDNGSITAISAYEAATRMTPDEREIPVTFSSLCQRCNQYVTWVLICIACVIVLSLFWATDVEGMNLLSLSRIAGHVWTGRSILFIRSVTAMWMLNTTPFDLDFQGRVTRIASPPLEWYKAVLAAFEVTWLVYVLNDLASCFTQQYTIVYASLSAHATFLAVAIWTALAPGRAELTIDRICAYTNMDAGVMCESGHVVLGAPIRLGYIFLFALGGMSFTYGYARWSNPHLPPVPVQTLLLSSQSFYMMHWERRVCLDQVYLDKSSAILAGVLAFNLGDKMYLFDIKSWRFIVLPLAHTVVPVVVPDVISKDGSWIMPMRRSNSDSIPLNRL